MSFASCLRSVKANKASAASNHLSLSFCASVPTALEKEAFTYKRFNDNAISALAMRFQLWQCDFSFGNAISALAMRFQLWQCVFSFGNAISALAMRFQLWQCDFSFDIAISVLVSVFQFRLNYNT
jgi:hypothetical protein